MFGLKLCILVAVCTVLPFQSEADLGAAIRRSSKAKSALSPLPIGQQAKSIALPLRRVGAIPLRGAPNGGNFYVGSITIGTPPQKMQVLFDTSSGHVLLSHKACHSKACLSHHRYSPWKSETAADVNAKGGAVQEGNKLAKGNVTRDGATIGFTQADLGDGEVKGVFVRDHVCLNSGSNRACTDVAVVAAINLTDVPFRAMPHDGIVGLGLEGLSSSPLCNFVGRLVQSSQDMLPHFGISFGAESGEILFGGHDRARITAPIQWFPVARPQEGFWQVEIHSVRVGDRIVDHCHGGCRAVIDTGASRLGVLAPSLPAMKAALASAPAHAGSCQGPNLKFDLGGMSIVLEAKDYADADCKPQLGPLYLDEPKFAGVYAFGESVLRRYYAAFDWEAKRLGFAPTDGKVMFQDSTEDTIFM